MYHIVLLKSISGTKKGVKLAVYKMSAYSSSAVGILLCVEKFIPAGFCLVPQFFRLCNISLKRERGSLYGVSFHSIFLEVLPLLAAWLPALEAAGIAVAMATINGFLSFPSKQVFPSQEGCIYPYIDVGPGQKLIQGAFSMSIEGRGKLAFIEGQKPFIIVELFRPGVKGTAKLPGTINNLT